MLKKIGLLLTALLVGTSGCSLLGGGGLSAGDSAEGDLANGVEIEDLIPNSEEVLLMAGLAVEDDWPAIEFSLKENKDGLSLLIEADEIDPVMVVVDADGSVLAAGDDWDNELSAFVSIHEVPAGARVVVFDISGDDGPFLLELDEADDYQWTLELDEDRDIFLLEDKENDLWEDILFDLDDLYRDSWETCVVLPMEIRGEKWIRIAVDSEQDCVMALLMVDGDDLEYVDYDDDTDGVNPVISKKLQPGDYLVVVDAYSRSENSEFSIEATELDIDESTTEIVYADEEDEWVSGNFLEGAMVINYWPEVEDYSGLSSEDQALVFEFEINNEGEYTFDATSETDTRMTIIDDNNEMLDYNDDGPEDLNPQLILQMSPGSYSAIVSPYSDGSVASVDFCYSLSAATVRDRGFAPMDNTFQMHSNTYWSIVFEPENTYEIFAESDVDLTLTVVDAEGKEYFSDDDGGDFNPYLEIECTDANSGSWDVDIETYSSDIGREEVRFVVRPINGKSDDTSATVDFDL